MSHIGRQVIEIPSGIAISFLEEGLHLDYEDRNSFIKVPKGIIVNYDSKNNTLSLGIESQKYKSLWGSTRTIISNGLRDIILGFSVHLELKGIGYRLTLNSKDRTITFRLGYADDITYKIPENVVVLSSHYTQLSLYSSSKYDLEKFVYSIRRLRPPEPYKGKGILFKDEKVVLREGKKD